MRALFLVVASVVIVAAVLYAGTTGKIVGTVVDARTGEPLPSVNVTVPGTTLGASTNVDGYFVILNIPPGSYRLVASLVGFRNSSAVDVRVASEALKGLVESGSRPVSLPDIEAVVATYSGFTDGELRSRRRTAVISQSRHLAMYLARQLGSFSYGEIGAYFGKRNHSSVVSAVEKVGRLAAGDDATARTVAALSAEFGF